MIPEADKKNVLKLISEAQSAGARIDKAAELLGLTIRTIQRWRKYKTVDQRKGSRATPANKLSAVERVEIVEVMISAEFKDSNPNQIVPTLADRGIYLGSESTMYRILKEQKMSKHRSSSHPATRKRPKGFIADGPNQVWSWDITYLPSSIKGLYHYLYMVVDIYSRKVVAHQVYAYECSSTAADLIADACKNENIQVNQLVLHSDNGAPMKGATLLAKLQELGIQTSFSRPSVSDDNPYSESLFKTLKYRPDYPEKPFASLADARVWSDRFVNWYNNIHKHSAIKYVTPVQRHNKHDIDMLKRRKEVYKKAKEKNPERWSRSTRNWDHIDRVALNKAKINTENESVANDIKVAA